VAEIALFEDLDSVAGDAAGALDRDVQVAACSTASTGSACSPRIARRKASCSPSAAATAGSSGWLFLAVRHPIAEAYVAWYSLRFAGDRQSRR
jgi:hypothetical protein